MFKYLLYKFGQFIVKRLPLKVAYGWATFISDLHYYASFRDRRAVKNNLRVIMPGREDINSLARQVFRNFGKYLVEFFRMTQDVDRAYIERNIEIRNLERLDEVLRNNKGAIFLTAHLGNWELGGVIMSLLGYPFVAIALPHKERPVNDLFNYQRENKGMTIVPTNIAVRKCIETLKKNSIVALLADRDFSGRGEILDFLGRKAFLPKGPAVFSQNTGAPIIPVFLIRKVNDKFTLTFEEPIYPFPDGEDQEKIRKIMKRYTAIMEERIRENPTQWLMFREFWTKQKS